MKKLVTILVAAVVLACAGGAFWFYGPFQRDRDVLRLPGTVEVQEVRLGSKLGGRVLSVSIREGDHVKAGQELVRFETPELDAQRAQLQARVAAAEADLLKARNGPRPEEKAEAKAMMESAAARLERAQTGWREEEKRKAKYDMEAAEDEAIQTKADFARTDKLYREGGGASVSRGDWDAARAARDRAQHRWDATKALYDMMMAGSRKEDLADATAELARATAHYTLLEKGTRPEEIAAAEARVAELRGLLRENEVNHEEAVVRAPGPAVVEVLAVRKGDLLPPNQPALRILRDDDLWVKVFVPETELGKVRLGQKAEVAVDSYPNRRFPGVVDQIANASEFTPRNVQSIDERRHQMFALKVRVDNSEGVFKSGMSAEVFLPLAAGYPQAGRP